MKREFVFGGLIALALSVGAAAQQYPPAGQDKDSKDKDTVTVTGCLVPGAGGAVGTSGTTSANPSAAAGFKLINATKDGTSTATTTAGTSGTTAGTTAPAADAGKSYTLIGGDQADLEKWVNSKVEIKGTIEAATATPPMTAETTPEKAPVAQRLRITSVRQVASTCTGQQ